MLWTEEMEFTCRNIIWVSYYEPMNDAFILAQLPYNRPLVNIDIPLSSKSFDLEVKFLHWTIKVIDIIRYANTAAVVYPYLGWICIKLSFISVGLVYLWFCCSCCYSSKGLELTWQLTSWWYLVPPDLVIHWLDYSAHFLMMVKHCCMFSRVYWWLFTHSTMGLDAYWRNWPSYHMLFQVFYQNFDLCMYQWRC